MKSIRNLIVCSAAAIAGLASTGQAGAQGAATAGGAGFPSIADIEKAAQTELQKSKRGDAPALPPKKASPTVPAPAPAAAIPLPRPVAPQALPSQLAPAPQQAATPAARAARLTSLLQQYGIDEPIPTEVLHGKLYVAVSLSIPEQTLKALVHQAAAAGAGVILNGFDGTLEKTIQRINRVLEEPLPVAQRASGMPQDMKAVPESLSDLSVRIAPHLFERFQITEVPAFVLVTPAGASDECRSSDCSGYMDFLHLSGDVSVAHALDAMARARPAYRASVGYFANRANLSTRVKKEAR
jgi:type-F conjugative transfer system pilin assembly protein TrbC